VFKCPQPKSSFIDDKVRRYQRRGAVKQHARSLSDRSLPERLNIAYEDKTQFEN
jgi:hypothetical protein